MPYFVYKLSPPRRLEPVATFEGYRDARARARALRLALGPQSNTRVRVVFAQDGPEAERLLSEIREPRPLGEEA